MRLSKYLDIILIATLAFMFISRGSIGFLNDIVTWIIALYYFLIDKNKIVSVNKYLLVSSFILVIYLTFNLLFRESSDYKVYYYFSILIPYYLIFKKPNRVYLFILISGTLCAIVSLFIILHLLGIITNYQLFYSRDGSMRASGFMYNPNYYAYMNLVIFILISLLPLKNYLKATVLLLIFLAIILSFSRGVIAALFFYIILSLFSRKWLKYIFILPLILIFMYVLSNNSIFDSLNFEILKQTFEYRLSNLKSGQISGRSMIWAYGFKAWFDNLTHVLFGFGFGNFQKYVDVYDVNNTVHNSYLRSLYELGLVGTIVIIGFYFSFIKNITTINNKKKAIIFFSILVSWFSNDFFINKDTFLLLSLLSLMYSLKINNLKLKGG